MNKQIEAMMSKQQEALRIALEALEDSPASTISRASRIQEVITALREALAEQPAQKCRWPTCQSEEYQRALAEQIRRELVG